MSHKLALEFLWLLKRHSEVNPLIFNISHRRTCGLEAFSWCVCGGGGL